MTDLKFENFANFTPAQMVEFMRGEVHEALMEYADEALVAALEHVQDSKDYDLEGLFSTASVFLETPVGGWSFQRRRHYTPGLDNEPAKPDSQEWDFNRRHVQLAVGMALMGLVYLKEQEHLYASQKDKKDE